MGWAFFSFIFTSAWFNIKSVEIDGNSYLSSNSIIKYGEIDFNTNIFHFNIKKANQNLLSNPWIKEVNIRKKLPNKLEIALIERKPANIVIYNDLFYLISQEGIILSILENYNNELGLYIISGLNLEYKKEGESIFGSLYQEIQNIIYALDNVFPKQFYKIKMVAEDEFLLYHRISEIIVRIENGDRLINEWYLLERALQRVIQEKIPIEEINMKYRDRLSIILKEEL
ncbi:MAG: FtsQ-type POTRA domain-containing protein [Atribacterota bacterium]|nr:FtsQ-type POTRA domain-containing protein [Atribacterota bacterium]